jgi:GH24 family phage-related lysozyme (muramidase)
LDLGVTTAAQDTADGSGDIPPPAGGAGAPAGGPGAPASGKLISDAARNLIVASEISSEAAYRKRYCRPEWPQGASGVTIGIGYDCGYTTADKLRQDWQPLPGAMVQALGRTVGVKGASAGPLARQLRESINVPWENALAVFDNRDVPRWVAIVRKALPNTELLSPDCLGALVSLAYNRGASFSKAGDRYREMRAIKAHMANKDFAKIPAEFRSMKRLWPSLRGLQIRRDQEADLFQRGLAANRA